LEPIGGTGEYYTGLASAFTYAELEPHEAANIAARVQPHGAGKYAEEPSYKIRKLLTSFSLFLKDYYSSGVNICYVKEED
jgi:hypothetical protein